MEGAGRGAALTQKLLAFGRRQPLAPQRLDANALIENMRDLLARAVGESIAIALKLAPAPWPVEVDPNQLENALLNLAVNARDAMAEGGALTIESRNCSDPRIENEGALAGDYVLLSVSDSGCGMSKEVRGHAFEPFYTTKAVGEGSGLGLSQVYGFAQQSNGHVEIESAAGAGTTVRIYLPRAS
jgi:signal transduction histidine kinase